MLQNLPDIVIGVVCFSVFLVLAVIVGWFMQRSAKSRNQKALKPLATTINGSIDGDHHAAWMEGEYRGRTVSVKMTPGRDIAKSSDYTTRINSFEIYLPNLSGAHDWEIAHTGILRKQLTVKAPDEALKSKLAQSNLMSGLQNAAKLPSLRYEARTKRLHWHEDARPRRAPKTEQFRARLDFLIDAAEINTMINPQSKV